MGAAKSNRRGGGNRKAKTPERAARAKSSPLAFARHWKPLSVGVLLLGLSAVGLAAYKQNWESLHDLSVIGNGTPTVVQVHDTSCALCRQLKTNTQKALKQVDGDIQYRIADLATPKGARIARRFHVGKVTLLTFDGDGRYLNDYNGVMKPDTIAHILNAVAGPAK